jgi:glyoxylase-like metal-dependent hydrolase (beta-lactamase superfamily II)
MAKNRRLSESVNNNITKISFGFVSMYVYKGSSATICIDTGLNVKGIQEEFRICGLNARDISAVFLTHSDRDHAGGVEAFTKAEVFMSFEEEEMIDRGDARFFNLIHNKKPRCMLSFLRDNDKIAEEDIAIKCISTPGHTLGSMSFLVDEKYLFVGDALNLKNGKAVMDRGFLQMDKKLQEESIRKLAKLNNIKMLLTAHTGFTDDFEKTMSEWRQA